MSCKDDKKKHIIGNFIHLSLCSESKMKMLLDSKNTYLILQLKNLMVIKI